MEVEWANVLLMLGALIVKAGVNADEQFIFTPYDFYDGKYHLVTDSSMVNTSWLITDRTVFLFTVDFNNECIDPDTAFVEGDQEAMADSD